MDSAFVDYLNKQTEVYFECNTSETSASIRWEVFKAFIRGQIICFISSKKRERTQLEMRMPEGKIKKLETDLNLARQTSIQNFSLSDPSIMNYQLTKQLLTY